MEAWRQKVDSSFFPFTQLPISPCELAFYCFTEQTSIIEFGSENKLCNQ